MIRSSFFLRWDSNGMPSEGQVGFLVKDFSKLRLRVNDVDIYALFNAIYERFVAHSLV